MCGIIGHTNQVCEQLFFMEHDDGSRRCDTNIKVDQRRAVGNGGNRWLRGEDRNDAGMAVPRRPAGGRVNHGGSHDFRYDRNNHNNEVPTIQEDVARLTDKGKIVVIHAHGSNMQMNVGSCTAGSSLGNTHLGPIEKKAQEGWMWAVWRN